MRQNLKCDECRNSGKPQLCTRNGERQGDHSLQEEQDERERREQCNACTAVKIYHIILLQSRAYAGDRR